MTAFRITRRVFGFLSSGEEVESWTLESPTGMVAEILTYGCVLRVLGIPGVGGKYEDVVLGYDDLKSYVDDRSYFGATVGRVAGRIPGASVIVEGKTHVLSANDGANHLHGGRTGFDKRLWTAKELVSGHAAVVQMTRLSPDGEEGYPGNLNLTITFSLSVDALTIRSEATTDATTPLSMTHHSYFNLAGESSGDVLDHQVQVFATEIFATDDRMTLTGNVQPVRHGSDLRFAHRLGDIVASMHNRHGDLYRLAATQADNPRPVARLVHPQSGRVMDVLSDEVCLQLYTGVHLDGSLKGKGGSLYSKHAGICLECQGYPDGANRPDLGSILLHPGETQRRCTVYRFSSISQEQGA